MLDVAEAFEEGGGEHARPAVDGKPQDVVDVVFEFEPGAAVGNDAGGQEPFAVLVDLGFEGDAG